MGIDSAERPLITRRRCGVAAVCLPPGGVRPTGTRPPAQDVATQASAVRCRVISPQSEVIIRMFSAMASRSNAFFQSGAKISVLARATALFAALMFHEPRARQKKSALPIWPPFNAISRPSKRGSFE